MKNLSVFFGKKDLKVLDLLNNKFVDLLILKIISFEMFFLNEMNISNLSFLK